MLAFPNLRRAVFCIALILFLYSSFFNLVMNRLGLILSKFVLAGLSLSSAFFLTGSISPVWAAPTNRQIVTLAQPMNLAQAIQQIALELVNRDRAAENLPPMEVDPLLSQAAQNHAEDMLRRNYFSHYSPEGQTPTDRLTAVGGYGYYPAENIVMDEDRRFRSPNIQVLESLENRWMQSPKHRHNLMNPNYERFGYGFAVDPRSGRTFAVQMFSRR
jgi:uncharacterized protein YkwD